MHIGNPAVRRAYFWRFAGDKADFPPISSGGKLAEQGWIVGDSPPKGGRITCENSADQLREFGEPSAGIQRIISGNSANHQRIISGIWANQQREFSGSSAAIRRISSGDSADHQRANIHQNIHRSSSCQQFGNLTLNNGDLSCILPSYSPS